MSSRMKITAFLFAMFASACATQKFSPKCEHTLYGVPYKFAENEVISELLTDNYIREIMKTRREHYHELRADLATRLSSEIDFETLSAEELRILATKLKEDIAEFQGYKTIPGTTKFEYLRFHMAQEIFNIAAEEVISEQNIVARKAWNGFCPIDQKLNQLIIERAVINANQLLKEYRDT